MTTKKVRNRKAQANGARWFGRDLLDFPDACLRCTSLDGEQENCRASASAPRGLVAQTKRRSGTGRLRPPPTERCTGTMPARTLLLLAAGVHGASASSSGPSSQACSCGDVEPSDRRHRGGKKMTAAPLRHPSFVGEGTQVRLWRSGMVCGKSSNSRHKRFDTFLHPSLDHGTLFPPVRCTFRRSAAEGRVRQGCHVPTTLALWSARPNQSHQTTGHAPTEHHPRRLHVEPLTPTRGSMPLRSKLMCALLRPDVLTCNRTGSRTCNASRPPRCESDPHVE